MSNDAQENKVDSELENRLDSLFDEDGLGADIATGADSHSKDPLDELKSLVMSIEWEITDDVMEKFLDQVDSLKTRFGEDRILVMFLQLLGSLGLYVKTNKGKAHPSSFKLLNSVYGSFEKAASPGKISPSEKKKLLYIELNKYKELKEQIESVRGSEPDRPSTATTGSLEGKDPEKRQKSDEATSRFGPSNRSGGITQAHFDEAVKNLKTSILNELADIRKELKRITKS